MKYCPKCGFENANYAKFCVKCGNSFVDMDINTIKKHNSIMNSMHSKETSEISQKKKVNNTFNESHFKDNGHTKPTFKFKLFHIFDERKNKYRISKLRVILSSLMEVYSIILFLLLLHISLFVDSEFFSSEFAVNPVVAILLLICASIVIAGIFVIPTGIIGWILRRIYLYLTK